MGLAKPSYRGWKPLPQLHSGFSGSKGVSSSIKLAASAASGWSEPLNPEPRTQNPET
jgi:hypothetical protein